MRLYLMRHGIAEDVAFGQSDFDRALTGRGVEKMRGQAMALRRVAWPVGAVVTSPLVRARQTAEIVAPAFGLDAVVDERLALGATPEHYAGVARDAPAEHVMLVGHQPDIEVAVHTFTGAVARVRKGSIAVIDMLHLRPRGGRLRALYDPSDLAVLGNSSGFS